MTEDRHRTETPLVGDGHVAAEPKTGGLDGEGAMANPKTGKRQGAPRSDAAYYCSPEDDFDITRGGLGCACPPPALGGPVIQL